jgi:hypothetical protein
MTTGTRPFRFAALTSLALILPFVVIQALVGGVGREGVPGVAVLFGLLWLLPTLSIGSSLRMLRPPPGSGRMTPRTRLLLSAAIILAAAAVWGTLLADQLPCFLGVPNCD